MQTAATLENASAAATADRVSRQQMPLSFLNTGETAHVLKVRGSDDLHHHLENLGFVAGAPLTVVQEQCGNLIVAIKGAQVALDRTCAAKIITC